jgi:hypothetical protein
MPTPLLKDGDLLDKNRFRVRGCKPIGQGQFAEVFRAVDERPGFDTGAGTSDIHVAVKIEREDKTSTRERRALQDLQAKP